MRQAAARTVPCRADYRVKAGLGLFSLACAAREEPLRIRRIVVFRIYATGRISLSPACLLAAAGSCLPSPFPLFPNSLLSRCSLRFCLSRAMAVVLQPASPEFHCRSRYPPSFSMYPRIIDSFLSVSFHSFVSRSFFSTILVFLTFWIAAFHRTSLSIDDDRPTCVHFYQCELTSILA